MTDLSSNERAFLKVSEELIRRQNDLEALKKIEIIASAMNDWTRKQVTLMEGRTNSEEYQGISTAVALICSQTATKAAVTKAAERVEKLKNLADVYFRGGDIVAHKLSQE